MDSTEAVYDAIVIGARCAGASTAMLLARAGHDVLLVDRGRFPSEIPHGHFIHRHGPARLSRWGLLDRVLATGCQAITSALSGSRPEADALAGYERRRNEATLPDYRRNLAEAELGPPPPELLATRASLRGDQEAINRYMLVGEGLIEPDGPAG